MVGIIERLRDTLNRVQRAAGHDFSGIGIIVSDFPHTLPICPLRPVSMPSHGGDFIAVLTTISNVNSEYHDGFHVLSTDFQLLIVSQYFSPPISITAKIDRTKIFGGRYLAALFGSTLVDVAATGIASTSFGLAVFRNGEEVHYEKAI